jgi:hypothetical protein
MDDHEMEAAIQAAILSHLPRDRIKACYARAPGAELRGKFVSPESSAALVANSFGLFLERPELLKGLPDGPALQVDLEREVRFPWSGGRHPYLDVLIESANALIGIESKRYEPFRTPKPAVLSAAYQRPVWGESMRGYEAIRDLLGAEPLAFAHLDAAQLVKHALGLRTSVERQGVRYGGKQPLLVYLYAEPLAWPNSRVIPIEVHEQHRREIERFAATVADDEVEFHPLTYEALLSCWRSSESELLRAHAQAIRQHFHLWAPPSPRFHCEGGGGAESERRDG